MAKIDRKDWKWFGHAGHLIVGQWCRFHLCTQVGDYLVSTVGEYWPERAVREIHAAVHDPGWLAKNQHLKGSNFDAAYMKRFGFEEIGCGRKYETMVFRAGEPCSDPECVCGMPQIDGSELEATGSNIAGLARDAHYATCDNWSDSEYREEVLAEVSRWQNVTP